MMPLKKKPIIFALVCVIQFCACLTFTVNNSFLPLYNAEHNITTTWTGAIIGGPFITNIMACALSGYLLNCIPYRRLFFICTLVLGSIHTLSALLDVISTTAWYEGVSFVTRVIQGFATGSIVVTTFAVVVALYPENTGTATAIGEASLSAALAIAPFIGSLLYSAGGFMLVMIVIGALIMLTSVLPIFMPQLNLSGEDSMDLKSTLKAMLNPWILFAAWHCCICTCILNYHGPILSTYAEETLGEGVIWSGLVLAIPSGMLCLIAFPIGFLIDRYGPYPFFLISAILLPIAYLFIGPSPLLTFVTPSKIQLVVVMAVIGLLVPMGCISSLPVMLDMQRTARCLKELSRKETNILVAIYCLSYPAGVLLADIVSGIVAEEYSFAESTGAAALVFFVHTLACCVYCGLVLLQKKEDVSN